MKAQQQDRVDSLCSAVDGKIVFLEGAFADHMAPAGPPFYPEQPGSPPPAPAVAYRFGGFRLDRQHRRLFHADSNGALPLTAKSIDTLLCLVERAGEVLDKDFLMRAVWPSVVVEENNLERHVSMLRRALGEARGENRFIATIPGRGYQFVATVEREFARAAEDAPVANTELIRHSPARRLTTARMVIGCTALICAALLALMMLWPGEKTVAVKPVSLAVLPFVDRTLESSGHFLAPGLAEEIIDLLTRSSEIPVQSSLASFPQAARERDVRLIARELDVSHVLAGSVDGTEGSYRISVQLIDGATGLNVWPQQFERTAADIQSLRAEVAAAIVQSLSPGAQAGALTDVAGERVDPEAHLLFLRANARAGASAANLRAARDLYDEALALDPTFARAYAARANTRAMQIGFGLAPPVEIAWAEADASRALELDTGLPGAHGALAWVQMLRGKWLDADRSLLEAGRLDPMSPALANHEAMLLASTGNVRQSLERSEAAYARGPLAVGSIMQLAVFQSTAGRHARALELLDVGVSLGAPTDLGGAPLVRAWAALDRADAGEAARWLARLLPASVRAAGGDAVMSAVCAAILEPSTRVQAVAALQDLLTSAGAGSIVERRSTLLIVLFTRLGDLSAAYDIAHRTLDHFGASGGVGFSWYALWAPEMREFRKDQRFQQLIQRLNLPAYWQAKGPPDGCTFMHDRLACQ